jgi:uncharacterized protein YegL
MKTKYDLDKPFNIELDDTVDNTTKVPVVMLLDVSASMYGEAIKELNSSVQTFIEVLGDDDYARTSVELSIVTFSTNINVIHDYSFVDDIYFENDLEVENNTNMGKAVNYALDSIQSKLKEYNKDGILYKAPLLLIITDGESSDDIKSASNRSADLITKKKLTFMGIGVGKNVNMNELKRFNPNGNVVLSPKHEDLAELLKWVSYQLSSAVSENYEEAQANELDTKFQLY